MFTIEKKRIASDKKYVSSEASSPSIENDAANMIKQLCNNIFMIYNPNTFFSSRYISLAAIGSILSLPSFFALNL